MRQRQAPAPGRAQQVLVLRGRLQRDLLRLGVVPCAAVTLALAGWFTRSRLDLLEAAFNAEGQAQALHVAALSASGLLARDLRALQHIADATLRGGELTRIEISSIGVFVAAGPPAEASDRLRSFTAPVTLRQASHTEGSADVSAGPTTDARPIGQVQASRDPTAHERERLRVLLAGIGVALVALLGAWLAVRRLARSVTRPLHRVLRTVSALGAGQFDARCDVTGSVTVKAAPGRAGPHELAALARDIDRLAERLQRDRQVCDERVREATAVALQRIAEADQAALSRARFLAAASHGLRQPLHAMGLFVDGLLANATPAQRPAVLRLQESTGFMGVLLDQLLDISRLDAHVMTPTVADVPLAALFSHLDAQCGEQAAAGSVRLLWRDGGLSVRSDGALLLRLLSHLVRNAIRNTPAHGTVLVVARQRAGVVRIAVRDNGIGIAPAQQSRIFEEFYQVANHERDPRQGFGLGLAISARLAALLGTRIALRSALQHGSNFALALPCCATVAAALAPAPHRSGASRLSGLRCLVVHNEPALLDASRALLLQWGCQVECASSVSQALARLDAPTFDVVLCDLQLDSDDDGMGVIEAAHRLHPAVLAVLVTAAIGADQLQRLSRSGTLLLSKPVAPAKLRALLSRRPAPD